MNSEFVPVLAGLVLGLSLRFTPTRRRLTTGLALAIVLGALATIASGEYKISGGYFLLDSLEVAVCAGVSWILSCWLYPASASSVPNR